MSAHLMNILADLTPVIEIYSTDKAFLKFNGFEYFNLYEQGEKIKQSLIRSRGLPVSLGFAASKALPEVVNRIAKKFPL